MHFQNVDKIEISKFKKIYFCKSGRSLSKLEYFFYIKSLKITLCIYQSRIYKKPYNKAGFSNQLCQRPERSNDLFSNFYIYYQELWLVKYIKLQ